jgi:hypothetical protein
MKRAIMGQDMMEESFLRLAGQPKALKPTVRYGNHFKAIGHNWKKNE